MWIRNILFIGSCLAGLAILATGFINSHPVGKPAIILGSRLKPISNAQTVEAVNRQFQQLWESKQLTPANRADDLTIARRLSLGLTGTIPSLEEIRALELTSSEGRIDRWLSHLLQGRRYSDYVAERLSRAYVGAENGPFFVFRRRRFTSWLSDRLYENKPYDWVVKTLIQDTGLWTDSPAVNFITVTSNEQESNLPDPIRLAGRTSRAFLGMRIDCLQCHDDVLGHTELGSLESPVEGKQSDFHQLAAYFSEVHATVLGIHDTENKYKYQYLDSESPEIILPSPPYLRELVTEEGTRREQLARWVTHPENKPFARSAVNRVWALMFGRPLVDPIDNIPLAGPFPPGLEILAEDFAKHGYDISRLIRTIAATEVFQKDSRSDSPITIAHEMNWAAFPLTRLRPEQAAGGLIQATSLQTINARSHITAQIFRFLQQNDFVQRYGDMGEDEFVDRGGTIPQRLVMMNGALLDEKTRFNPIIIGAPSEIALFSPDADKAIETAYLAVLSRRPSAAELKHFSARIVEKSRNQRVQDIIDLYWVLLNSTEFSWSH